MLKPQKILVPIDFSETSAKAVQYGSEFARTFGAELTLCYVFEPPIMPMAVGFGAMPPVMMDEIRPKIQERLDGYVSENVHEKVKVDTKMLDGTPFVEIVRYARDAGKDLIIMPTHGRSGIAHMFLGSTTERVVRKAPCPVLVLRSEEQEFIRP
jgi:nucleotide-binding universal stress UspA family protein